MKNTFLIIVFMAFVSSLPAQDQQDYRRDIGFSTNFIIGQVYQSSPQAPFSVMLKRYTSTEKAFRIGLDALFDIASSKGNNNPQDNYSDQNNLSLSLVLGKEFQRNISRHWCWYWGIDLAPKYTYYNTVNFRDKEKTSAYKTQEYGLAIKPLAGIRFNINERLYLSAEAAASLSIKAFENKSVQYGAEVITQHTEGTIVDFDFFPASSLFLFYRF